MILAYVQCLVERVVGHVREGNCGIKIDGRRINNLSFSDDIVPTDEHYKSLQRFEAVKATVDKAGVVLNVAK